MSFNTSSQSFEQFWGLELSKDKKELKWEEEIEDDDSDTYSERTLELRQACLGASAKEGERNVVEVKTENDEGDKVTHTILSMGVGKTEQCALFLTLQPPVTFRLAQGNGPVHIVGLVNETMDFDMDSDEDEDDDGEEAESLAEKTKEIMHSKKRPANSPLKAPPKIAKVNKSMDVNANWEDDSEEDEDYEEDNSEEEDESGEEESGEGEESEEEELKEQVKLPPKKSQSANKDKTKTHPNGSGLKKHTSSKGDKLGTSAGFKTPQPPKQASGKPQKGSRSLPNTPKVLSDKKTQGKGPAPDLNEIKQRLIKMAVPKKLDKFNNFISNSFKIKEDSIKKQLWEFVQKKRPQA